MKPNIHPTYYPDAKVICACGNTWTTGSTKKEIRTEVCSKCHPFYTGQQQRMLDMEGQVDRFYKRLQARQDFVEKERSREVLERRSQGEAALLEVEGFGRKSLIDLKKKLRQMGYELPAAAEDIAI
jgi:large subunit ribosomal protein L31